MLPSTRKISIIVAMITLPLCTFAISKKEAAKLEAISKEMYEQGNEQYIYVDAYKDGLLKDGEVYTIMYDSNDILLSGKPVSDAYKEKYRRFLFEKQGGKVVSGKGTGTLRVKDFYDKSSCFRRNYSTTAQTVAKLNAHFAMDAIINEMVKDGVLKDATKYSFQWKRNAIRINGEKLPKSVAQKYIAKLEKIDGLRTGNSYGYTVNMN